MAITRVGLAHPPGRQAGRRGEPCAGERSDGGVRDLYREYAGGGRDEKTALPERFSGRASSINWNLLNGSGGYISWYIVLMQHT